MVSTRGVRYKYSEGERVLCYEPDPTKAKVLYDSKVLEVIENKDKRGRRTVEYLIHFQGWNSSWDRCVSEDFVLKDTEENRQLQRDLAEKSQLQLGAYLYRRERKKGSGSSGTTGGGAGKRARREFSDDGGSSSSTPLDEAEIVDTDSSSGDGSGSQPEVEPEPPAQAGRAQLTIPPQLRDRLTFDYHLVVKRGRLARLPASPAAVDILESFVKWFARAGAWHPPRGRHDPPARPDLNDVSCRLNLVREMVDGLRVYFDFILRGHLLYKQELKQYLEVCGSKTEKRLEEEIKALAERDSKEQKAFVFELKSPKLPEYAHLPPDPRVADNNTVEVEESPYDFKIEDEFPKVELHEKFTSKPEPAPAPASAPAPAPVPASASRPTRELRPCTRSGNLARRLRSHKSAVSQAESEEPAASTSAAEPRAFETLSSSVGSSGSSLSEWSRAPNSGAAAATTTRTPLSLLLDKVAKWEIIKREEAAHLPCCIYGATHLARLFVKLPDFLNATQMTDYKLKLVLKHVEMFVNYLEEHSEWFGESNYTAEVESSRSH